jgi:vitamin B12 transporter
VTGQAILNFPGIFPNTTERVNNRDHFYFESDYPFTQHIFGMFGFHYEDERGARKSVAYSLDQNVGRTNYDYTGQLQGDFKSRVFYSLGGNVEKNHLFGTIGTPRTKIRFQFAKGYQEPSLDEQMQSLYSFLAGTDAIAQFRISPISAEESRTYEGGVEQSFLSERGLLRVGYFHNEFGRQIESVPATEVPKLLPQLSASEQIALESLISNTGALAVNSQAFRAQGIESQADFSLFRTLLLRGGYTYLDSVVQRSFTADALAPSFNPAFSLPIGASGPLRGARPFQRPPHTGFAGVTYSGEQYWVGFTASFATRSDDSTFLAGRDFAGGNSLLLPNRNLDYGYSKLDLGGSYQLLTWAGIYAQLDNLTSNKRIGQIGYPSLPFTFRLGLRLTLGHTSK